MVAPQTRPSTHKEIKKLRHQILVSVTFNKCAVIKIRAGFIISVGCKETPNRRIHRLAPFTSSPTKRVATIAKNDTPTNKSPSFLIFS